jgi:hypothetical protein
MPPKKLTDADKKEILALYRQLTETSVTLAERYGVSTSTISRILKQNLPDAEYEELIHQKRSIGRGQADTEAQKTPEIDFAAAASVENLGLSQQLRLRSERELSTVNSASASDTSTSDTSTSDASASDASDGSEEADTPRRRQRRRSGATTAATQLDLMDTADMTAAQSIEAAPTEELAALAESELLTGEEFADDLDDDDDEGDLDLEDDFDGDEEGDFVPAIAFNSAAKGQPLEVLPLTEAPMPKVCYLVIDRFADLITRPLRDFGDLGDLPYGELQERILPVFDNHRVARRFSRRMQRIVKVPDGRVFYKVGSHLQAKGITRLLIDGQIYSVN